MQFRLLALLLFSTLIPITLYAQSDRESSSENERTIFDIRSEGGNKYLKVLNELKAYEAQDRMQQSLKKGIIVPVASFMAPNSEYDNLLQQQRFRFRADSLLAKVKEHGHSGMEEVKQVLKTEIENRNLVMFNEYHFYPNHRILVQKLLPLFKEAGYTFLALEALSAGQDSLLNAGHPPTIQTGFYTKDPHFANLIRTAQELDFTLVAYEKMRRGRDREEGQAADLIAATFEKDPDAKVLVLAGVDHILEKPTSRGKRWLGNVLNEQYDLNPLTIGQHHLRYFEGMVSEVTMVDAGVFDINPLTSVDYQLVNSLPLSEEPVNFEFTNKYNDPVQLSIYLEKEHTAGYAYDKLIPVNSRLVEANETVNLHLPDYTLQMIIYDDSGTELERRSINN